MSFYQVAEADTAQSTVGLATSATCLALAQLPWPQVFEAQTALLRRLESQAEECKGNAQFQAALGGAWLELGDPQKALIRLERALLLNPALDAARADHALALAALGEPQAREELLRAWQGRTDVPPVVWRRLMQPILYATPIGPQDDTTTRLANGQAATKSWQQFREIQLLVGHESNLAQSPRLSELTITPPDGPIRLELENPLRPRSGQSVLLDGAWQVAYSPDAARVYGLGVQASARSAVSERDTDWHSLRLAFSASQRLGAWRGRTQLRGIHAGGGLFERSNLWRWDFSLEGPAGPCSQQWMLEAEGRSYAGNPNDNAETDGLTVGLLCSATRLPGWTFGIFARTANDRARSEQRPGGDQKQSSLALRALVELGPSSGSRPWVLDVQWRNGAVKDQLGYSPLFENNAKRQTRTQQFQFEAVGPGLWDTPWRTETVLRLQYAQQKSNLPVFAYDALAVYGGLRWRW